MYKLSWDIEFSHESKKFNLPVIAECEINKSVDSLVATAVIILPEYIANRPLNLEKKIPIGSQVKIKLGYDDVLINEFSGYVQRITNVDSCLKIFCEDDMYVFRKPVKNEELKPTSIDKIAQTLLNQVMPEYTLNCDYELYYEKFVIFRTTAYDVLKKLQEESAGNIYLDTENKVLHIHPPYAQKKGEVKYSMQHNIEKASLEYKKASDKKIQFTDQPSDKTGILVSETYGNEDGEKKTVKISSIALASLKIRAKYEYTKHAYDGYEGTFDTWLLPYVEPSYSAKITDEDYPDKNSKYYVVSVKTSFSSSGGKRTITPGILLSV